MTEGQLFFWLEVETVALIICVISLVFAYKRKSKFKRLQGVMADILDIPGRGLVLFSQDKNFFQANKEAMRFVSYAEQHSGNEDDSSLLTLEDFLNYAFDHAVEEDESVRGTLSRFSNHMSDEGFKEIIRTEDDTLCLVDAARTEEGRYVISLYDLSSAQRDEEKALRLASHSLKLSSAIEAATNGIVMAKRSGDSYKILFANKAFYALASVPEGDVLGKDAKQVFYAFINDTESRKSIFDALNDLEDTFVDLKASHPSNPRWYSMKFTPTDIENDDGEAFIAVFTDITELKIKESEFSRAQKMEALGQLAAGVAHDFNNILSIINGYSRMAGKKAEDQTLIDYMDKIQHATDRGAKLTSQLLTFSRHKVVGEEVINLAELLEEQETLLRPLLPASIKVVTKIYNEPLMIEAPSDHIMQMVMNLSLNAKEAMSDGGVLMLEARRIEAEELSEAVKKKCGDVPVCCFSVSDNGTGMRKAILDKIFDPFFTTKDKGKVKGTGLGLFMAYGLIQQMGGHIEVESEVGEGTSFKIYCPITQKTQTKNIQGDLDDLSSVSFDGYTALIAEDEPDLLDIVSGMLQDLGMNVLKAANGNEALVLQDDHEGKIDLLLTDVIMPELGGVKLAELFKAECPETPIIFMSGYPAGSQELKSDLPESSLFIAKPIKYDQLIQIIFQILKHPQGGKAALDALLETEQGQAALWKSDEVVERKEQV